MQVIVPYKPYLIFDCDGLLVDSEKYSCNAWVPVLRELGVDFPENFDYRPVLGMTSESAILFFCEIFNLDIKAIDSQEIKQRKEQEYFKVASGKLHAFRGVKSLLIKLQAQNIPRIVASSGAKEKINFNLKEADLKRFFDDFVSADEVKQGKPNPDLFLKAAEKLEAPTQECLVFEDSPLGVQAGKRAGMFVIAVTNTVPANKLQEADLIIESFEQLILKDGLLIRI
ncbi:MAG: HAD family hydrolase [Candidatus Hermodarchaeota archaeon]